jgi:hypothetical protein
MPARHERVIIEDGLCASCAVHTKHVHHRDFPDIRVEAGTVPEAIAHLGHQLDRAREGARGEWQREAIDLAIADVANLRKMLAQLEEDERAKCECGAKVAGKPGRPKTALKGRMKRKHT